MQDCNPADTPTATGVILVRDNSEEEVVQLSIGRWWDH